LALQYFAPKALRSFYRRNEAMNPAGLITLLFVIVVGGFQTQQKDPCDGETTFEMKQCAAKKYKQADDELNKVYRQLMSKLDNEGHKTSLKTAQQAWLKYRDNNCDFVSFLYQGGSIYSVIVVECRTTLTNTRTKELKEQIAELDR
jgi:uncharacterized protein YecT (DUF1311 family)